MIFFVFLANLLTPKMAESSIKRLITQTFVSWPLRCRPRWLVFVLSKEAMVPKVATEGAWTEARTPMSALGTSVQQKRPARLVSKQVKMGWQTVSSRHQTKLFWGGICKGVWVSWGTPRSIRRFTDEASSNGPWAAVGNPFELPIFQSGLCQNIFYPRLSYTSVLRYFVLESLAFNDWRGRVRSKGRCSRSVPFAMLKG